MCERHERAPSPERTARVRGEARSGKWTSGSLSGPGFCGGASDDGEVAQERVGSRAAPRRAGCAGWTVSSPPAAHRVRTPGAHTGCAHRVRTPGAQSAHTGFATGCAHRVRTPGAHTGCAHRVRTPGAHDRVRTPYATGVLDTPGKPDVTGAPARALAGGPGGSGLAAGGSAGGALGGPASTGLSSSGASPSGEASAGLPAGEPLSGREPPSASLPPAARAGLDDLVSAGLSSAGVLPAGLLSAARPFADLLSAGREDWRALLMGSSFNYSRTLEDGSRTANGLSSWSAWGRAANGGSAVRSGPPVVPFRRATPQWV